MAGEPGGRYQWFLGGRKKRGEKEEKRREKKRRGRERRYIIV